MASRLQDVIQRDTRANQPLATAVAPGTLYFVTDEVVIERSDGTNWETYSGAGTTTAVTGPGSSTDNAIARWDGATGNIIQDSAPLVEDDGRISTVTDPTGLQDAATKNYVDVAISNVNVGGAAQNSFLVSGGEVAWVSDYIFDVSAAQYYIQGVLYNSAADQVTLTAADPTNDRIDVIAVDNTGSVIVVDGTAAAQPSEPDIDPGTQLKLGIVLVTANTTEPTDANKEVVYYDNAGAPGEWVWTSSGASIVVNSVNNPKAPSTTCIEATTAAAGVIVKGIVGTPYDTAAAGYLILYIRSKASWANNRGLTVTLRDSDVLVGSAVNINRTGTFGFNSATLGVYQLIAIPTVMFSIPAGLTIDEVRITTFGTGHGFYIDDIFFQEGGNTQTGEGLTQEQADARYLLKANNLTDLASATTATAQLDALVGDAGAGGTKGLVPAPAAGDAAAGKYLAADGTWDVPSGSGINELTGDVTAGPGSGAQAATLADTAVTPGSYTNADITVDSKGRLTAAASGSTGTVTANIGVLIDGAGVAITTGVKGFVRVPVNCTITRATVLSIDASATAGSIVIDIWKDTYANYPPTVADTITAAAKPTLSAANKSDDSTLTGWTTAITAGDILGFNVDSAATVTKVILQLTVTIP